MLTIASGSLPDPPQPPFDRWLSPDGRTLAEFFRLPAAPPAQAPVYLVRFPGQADFRIALAAPSSSDAQSAPQSDEVIAFPAAAGAAVESLYHNAIVPMLGNHRGGLFLHGSAVASDHGALAFMGHSRGGKTTLAGAFARAGHPFLTEDVLAIERHDLAYRVLPQRPVLRLFADSAAELLGPAGAGPTGDDRKREFAPGQRLPHASGPARLRAIFLLGPGEARQVRHDLLHPAEALGAMMGHGFILDVNDRPRLRAHFERIAALAQGVECHALDYPRDYAHLPQVIAGVLGAVAP